MSSNDHHNHWSLTLNSLGLSKKRVPPYLGQFHKWRHPKMDGLQWSISLNGWFRVPPFLETTKWCSFLFTLKYSVKYPHDVPIIEGGFVWRWHGVSQIHLILMEKTTKFTDGMWMEWDPVSFRNHIWLVLQYPSKKIWLREWEGWHPIFYGQS